MKILSWNIERPIINDNRKNEIIHKIESYKADLIFLTETNSDISFKNYHRLQTLQQSPKYKNISYQLGENKATIYSKYNIEKEVSTYDNYSSICAKIETEFGKITLYCSIIGFLGGKDKYFNYDLKKQKEDISEICKNSNICFSGDLNIAFSGYPYPSKTVRDETKKFFELNNLTITTKSNNNCAIHIVISNKIIENRKVHSRMVTIPRKISDHNIVITEIT